VWNNVKKSLENKSVNDIVVMIGLDIVRCAELDHFPLLCLVTGKTTVLRYVTPLTLRRLMSYIYMEHPFLMFLDHTQRRSTVGRTPLDE